MVHTLLKSRNRNEFYTCYLKIVYYCKYREYVISCIREKMTVTMFLIAISIILWLRVQPCSRFNTLSTRFYV